MAPNQFKKTLTVASVTLLGFLSKSSGHFEVFSSEVPIKKVNLSDITKLSRFTYPWLIILYVLSC